MGKLVFHPAQKSYLANLDKGKAVFRGDAFDMSFYPYVASDMAEAYHSLLNEKRFTTNKVDVSTRVAIHWEEEGVIDDEREEGKGWRRYSLLGLIWLQAVSKLRKFGYPMNLLTEAKKSLDGMFYGSTENNQRVSLLEYYVVRALLRERVYLLAFEDGTIEIASESECTNTLFALEDHIRIGFNPIVQRLFPTMELTPMVSPKVSLQDKEAEILIRLRTGNISEMNIQLKDGDVKTLKITEEVTEKKLFKLLREHPYQDINMIQRDRKVISVSRTVIEKF